jgi:ubiquinone/menaquinone biosynthesis C-methylase UbiE
MIKPFNITPTSTIKGTRREIYCFENTASNNNIHKDVIDSFGEEWKKFHQFTHDEMENYGQMYFDIVDETMLNKNSYAIDIGCGTGRWTKYLESRMGFMEAIDPSDAIFVADKFLTQPNVRLSKASVDNIPFDDETFDFAMCVGVLQFIPDTQKAMNDCVKKVKIGGYFFTYLYYNLENRNVFFKMLFAIASAARKMISSFSTPVKKFICDIIAVVIYMPFVLTGRFLKILDLKKVADKMPLSTYQSETFFVIRNDALDRFGTSVEKRFSKAEVEAMMKNAGLENIVFSEKMPYWHAVGKRLQ